MTRLLIQFAHPALEKSRVNRLILSMLKTLDFVTINDLYENYPDFDIDIDREQQLLLDHEYVILQHPFYWYSSPAIIKQWEDLVLEHGWAYGREGVALTGKKMMNAVTVGGRHEAYREGSFNRFTIRQFLAPFDQTANLCKMTYLPPFIISGTHRLTDEMIRHHVSRYQQFLEMLASGQFDINAVKNLENLNDLIPLNQPL
ncbi:NAD(P)H-dependent oxidoreductase [Nibrella saemangeumensis]|uniref:NAD(P)H-dependent oxidoreductase n=1 Tax=Nibrella saemangeumensis TaxID=1084526 RepID=A0ABP8N4K4_9BACT